MPSAGRRVPTSHRPTSRPVRIGMQSRTCTRNQNTDQPVSEITVTWAGFIETSEHGVGVRMPDERSELERRSWRRREWEQSFGRRREKEKSQSAGRERVLNQRRKTINRSLCGRRCSFFPALTGREMIPSSPRKSPCALDWQIQTTFHVNQKPINSS